MVLLCNKPWKKKVCDGTGKIKMFSHYRKLAKTFQRHDLEVH
jgi:hypothetical protein